MLWVSTHAAERFLKRSNSKLSIEQAKIFVRNRISKFSEILSEFGGGTVRIKGTNLKAVVSKTEDENLVVVTVVTNNMYDGAYSSLRKEGKRRNSEKNKKADY